MSSAVRIAVDPARILDQAIAALNRPGATLPLAAVEQALKGAPTDARLWHVKGLIHREQDRRELAIPALRRAVDLAPNDPLIAHGFARALLEAGLPCVPEFGRAIRLSKDSPNVLAGLVAALVAEGRTGEAIEGLEQVLGRSPLWVEGHSLITSLRWAQGEREGFARSFDQALALHPNNVDLRREQMIALLHAEEFDEVLSRVEEGRRMFGEHSLFTIYEAIVRSERGEAGEADRLFEELAPLGVANFDVRRVRHLLRSGRPAEASEAIEPWLQTDEQNLFWPYAASAWRLTNDHRSDWLEGDERFVGIYDLEAELPPLDRLAETLRKLHTARGQLLAQSVRGGTQTDGQLFHRIEPEIVKLREAIRRAVRAHADQLPPVDPTHPLLRWRPEQIFFNGSWSVRLMSGGCHANHVHPLGWLSSALYVVLPPDLGQNHAGWLTLGEPPAELKLDLPPHRMIEPKPGRLALFPSWMWHGTRPFTEGERITVAFDVASGPQPPG